MATWRFVRGHYLLELLAREPFEPYNHLRFPDEAGVRQTWAVLLSKRNREGRWEVTAIRCPSKCRAHLRPR